MGWVAFLTRRHLGSPLKRGIRLVMFLATFGVALGVATLAVTHSVARGLEKVFVESILGFNAHLVVLKFDGIEDPAAETKRIQMALGDQWKATTPFLYREVLLVSKGKVKGAALKGIDPLTFSQVYAVKVRPAGDAQVTANIKDLFQSQGSVPRVILGKDLAEELGINASGVTIKAFVPKRLEGKPETAGSFQALEVSGIFETGIYQFDRDYAFVDLAEMQRIFASPGAASGIEVKLHDPNLADKLATDLKEQNFRLPYDVLSWQKMNAPFFRASRFERIVFLLLMSLVVVIASFNVVGVLLLMIFDKTREISILRALGASEWGLRKVFGGTGILLGAGGTGLGLVLGLVITWLARTLEWIRPVKEVQFVDKLPLDFSPTMIATVIGASLVITGLATIFGVSRLKSSGLDL